MNNPGMSEGGRAKRRPLISLELLRTALSDDVDLWTDEDIQYAPEELVVSQLAELGIPSHSAGLAQQTEDGETAELTRGDIVTLMPAGNPSSSPLAPQFHVPRTSLVNVVLEAVREHVRIYLHGPARSGKTFFLNALFLPNEKVREAYPRVSRIDCSALRMDEHSSFEREAVWALFGKRDDAFRRFIGEFTPQSKVGPLIGFLERKLSGSGLVVLDHAEYLSRSGGIAGWLEEKFLPAMVKAGIAVIVCSREPEAKPIRAFQDMHRVAMPQITPSEVDAWLGNPHFAEHRASGLTTSRVLRMTGGSLTLIRDLGSFLAHNLKFCGWQALCQFARRRAEQDYMTDCERYIRAVRRQPQVLIAGLKFFDGYENAGSRPEDPILNRIIASGAVKEVGDKKLQFVSPIHARRIRVLTTLENIARLSVLGSLKDLDRTGELKQLKKFAELASNPLAKVLSAERHPYHAFARFEEFLSRWGFNASIYVRDPCNARLWSRYDRDKSDGTEKSKVDGLHALSSFEYPDFARAAQTGQATFDESGTFYLPVTGNSGLVEMMVAGTLRQEVCVPRRAIEIERLIGVMRGLRPTLAQLLERLAFRREKQFRQRMLQRVKVTDSAYGRFSVMGVLQHASCSALAILERSPTAWFITRFETVDDDQADSFHATWAEPSNIQRLDAIAAHPSGRGLVIDSSSVSLVFPRLRGSDITIYLRPVWIRERRACRLVAFLFLGTASRELNGQLQSHLSAVAPEVVAAAS